MDLLELSTFDIPIIMAGFIASLIAGVMTGVGALPIFLVQTISLRIQNMMLGFAAGVMLAASFFSLILPALEILEARGANDVSAVMLVNSGILSGAVILFVLHEIAPHEHFIKGSESTSKSTIARIWLFVIAITIHNFPEGLAVGVGFGGDHIVNGVALAAGIGIQNMPEGLAVAVALLSIGYSKPRAFWIALMTGLVEPIGGLIGITLVTLAQSMLPWGLAFAAGAMLFVISAEIIPETHRKGYATHATFALMLGFTIMMFLDVTLG